MSRFIPTFLVTIAVLVGVTSQLCVAQVQIVDGDGKQVAPNQIPAEIVDEPIAPQAPEVNPQIFGGGSKIIIRQSFQSVDENGNLKTENSGKAIVIGPDGKRQEFDLEDGAGLQLGPMRIDGLVPGAPNVKAGPSFSLGLQCQPVPAALASQLELEDGLMVTQVPPGSAAANAGLQPYDVLLFADDKQLIHKSDLSQVAQAAGEADANVTLTLIRGGKEMSVTVKPEKRLAGSANPNLFDPFEPDDLFGEDALGKGFEARLRLQRENMQEHMRRLQEQLGNGLIEIPRLQQ